MNPGRRSCISSRGTAQPFWAVCHPAGGCRALKCGWAVQAPAGPFASVFLAKVGIENLLEAPGRPGQARGRRIRDKGKPLPPRVSSLGLRQCRAIGERSLYGDPPSGGETAGHVQTNITPCCLVSVAGCLYEAGSLSGRGCLICRMI